MYISRFLLCIIYKNNRIVYSSIITPRSDISITAFDTTLTHILMAVKVYIVLSTSRPVAVYSLIFSDISYQYWPCRSSLLRYTVQLYNDFRL